MNNYKYIALNPEGKQIQGTMQAASEVELHSKLKVNGCYLKSYRELSNGRRLKRMRSDHIADFSRNLGKLVGGGVPLTKAMKIICDDENIRPEHREIYQEMLRKLYSGSSLSEAMAEQGDTFPPMFIGMYRSSETAGTMAEMATQMADYYDKEYKLNKKIKAAVFYPKMLSVLVVAVVIVILCFVIPRFEQLFSRMEVLPWPTRVLFFIRDMVVKHWAALALGVLTIIYLLRLMKQNRSYRRVTDKLKVSLPFVGRITRTIYTTRYARTLARLYNAGVPIITAMSVAGSTVGNSYLEEQLERAITDVKNGQLLSEAMAKVDGMSPKLMTAFVVGEETGALDSTLMTVSDQLDYDSEMALNSLVLMIEPAMIVLMAIVVGFIMIAVIMPIYGSYENISNRGGLL